MDTREGMGTCEQECRAPLKEDRANVEEEEQKVERGERKRSCGVGHLIDVTSSHMPAARVSEITPPSLVTQTQTHTNAIRNPAFKSCIARRGATPPRQGGAAKETCIHEKRPVTQTCSHEKGPIRGTHIHEKRPFRETYMHEKEL
mmetsp:Transcript_34557/g.55744  ORF Transcript_34557/g.55744 Transcript_34557/m.55744 type:complete len:145 (+) Transcript_34557:362-796(+)